MPFPIPPAGLRFVNETEETFVPRGVELADLMRIHGLKDTDRLLDVGSGYGRLAAGLEASGFAGHYVGFDILRKHVGWCQENMDDGDRWRFIHLDIANDRYNAKGTIPADQATFPVKRSSQDFAVLTSVFSHMYEVDIRRYLSELRRVLVPGGLVAATFYLYDEARIPTIADPERQYPVVHELNDHCRYASSEDPLLLIAYEEDLARAMCVEEGFDVVSVTRGTWANDQQAAPGTSWQDLVVLRRPEATRRERVSGWFKKA